MKNPSDQNQTITFSSMPTGKSKLSKAVLIFLGFLILLLVVEGFYYFKLKKHREAAQQTLLPAPKPEVFFPTPISHPLVELGIPIEKQYLGSLKIIQTDFGVDDLAIYLPEGSPFYTAFPGRVEAIGREGDSQKVILLTSQAGDLVS